MFWKTVLFGLLISSTVYAQSKVGTTGDSFLEMVPSVRSLAMGGAGAALIDRQSHYSNPATLGLSDDYLISFAFRPVETKVGDLGRHQSLGLSSRLARLGNSWRLSAAFQTVGLTTGPFIERTYQYGTYEGTGRTFDVTASTYSLTVAVARASRLSVGFGGSIQYIEEDLHDFRMDGYAYDLGAILAYPITFSEPSDQPATPKTSIAAGVAVKLLGPDLESVNLKLPLPSALSFGLSFVTRSADLAVIVTVEEETSTKFANGEASLGAEIGVRDAVWLRVGLDGDRDSKDLTTFGAALSVRGLFERLITRKASTGRDSGFLSNVDLIGSYASSAIQENNALSGADYWQIEIVF